MAFGFVECFRIRGLDQSMSQACKTLDGLVVVAEVNTSTQETKTRSSELCSLQDASIISMCAAGKVKTVKSALPSR